MEDQGLSTPSLLTFGARRFGVWFCGCLLEGAEVGKALSCAPQDGQQHPWSLTPRCQEHIPPSCDPQKCLPSLLNVPWESKMTLVGSTGINQRASPSNLKCERRALGPADPSIRSRRNRSAGPRFSPQWLWTQDDRLDQVSLSRFYGQP